MLGWYEEFSERAKAARRLIADAKTSIADAQEELDAMMGSVSRIETFIDEEIKREKARRNGETYEPNEVVDDLEESEVEP